MFDPDALNDYVRRRGLTAPAVRVIEGVRNSDPSRRVKSGKANVSCRFASVKMGCVIQAESHKNELAAVVGWEYDHGTHEYYDQPPRIKLSYQVPGRRRGAHLVTPDYFVLQEDFTGWIECKTEEWLRAHAQDGSPLYVPNGSGGWRCPPGEAYAAEFGLEFRVRSSVESNWIWIRNVEFLADYLDCRCPTPKRDEIDRIRSSYFKESAWQRLKDLLEADLVCSADTLFKMIADRQLYVDLEGDLLTEPERTRVFRDALSAEAYRHHSAVARRPTVLNSYTLRLVPGQTLLWDGQPWRILSVGDEKVFLENDDHELTTPRRSLIDQLVRDGSIQCLPVVDDNRLAEADRVLRRAGPVDCEHALHRLYCLFPEKATGVPPAASERALRKWRALYRQGEQLLGSGFLGLLPKLHARGNRERKLDEQVLEVMDAVIDEHYAVPDPWSVVVCWGEVSNRCEARGLTPPSEQAFREQIRRRRAYELKRAQSGDKAAYSLEEFHWRLDQSTPHHGERPFEIGHIDHTELDLQFIGSRRGEKLGRAWLTVFIDAFTRMILAWVIMFESPSYRSCMMVIRECVRRHQRVPRYVVVDKGAEFDSQYFEELLPALEASKKTRPGGKPRFGTVIERIFGTNNRDFIHNLMGNNQALQAPRSMSKSYDPRHRAVWTLEEFNVAFEGYLEQVYSEKEHQSLGMSPRQAMVVGLAQSGLRKHAWIPFTLEFQIRCLPSTRKGSAKVDPARGVKIGYIYYWTAEFRDPAYAREDVPVRYDPFDVSVAYVWLKDHWAQCRSEYAAEFEGYSEKEILMATQAIRARNARTGERRSVNAKMIARYMVGTKATEKSLLQRKRQQEMHDASRYHVKRENAKRLVSMEVSDEEDIWGRNTGTLLEDLV